MSHDRPPSPKTITDPRAATVPARELRGFSPTITPNIVDPNAVDAPLPTIPPAAPEADTFAVRYDTRDILGVGGMGEVHLFYDRRIGREVAAKSIRRVQGRRAELEARFLREARVQGQLEHPAVVPVYDLGVAPGGNIFFTMKRVRGMTLAQVIDQLAAGDRDVMREYSLRKVLGAFASVCLAVDFAHTRGVIHRDLKPDNVMLGGFGEVYVLDWGVARVRDAQEIVPISSRTPIGGVHAAGHIESSDDWSDASLPSTQGRSRPGEAAGSSGSRDTEVGAVVGTPGYMPPEQLRGEDADERADVYALGAILFEILTLEPLHPRAPLDALVLSTLERCDARASVRAPERDIAPELESICVRATAKQRQQRYPRVRDLVDDLEHYLDGDRDLARRRELAAHHAHAARVAAERAIHEADPEQSRKTAMRELGRALALEPGHPDAMKVMVDLLAALPAALPREAENEIEARYLERLRSASRTQIAAYGVWFLIMPMGLAMGARALWPWVAGTVLVVTAACTTWLGVRTRKRSDEMMLPLFAHACVCAVVAILSRLFGVFMLTPVIATVSVLGLAINRGRVWRVVAASMAVAGMLAPLALELLGVIPPMYVFEGGDIRIMPSATTFEHPALSLLFLAFSNVGCLAVGVVFIGAARDSMLRLERTAAMQAWHFRQLAPLGTTGNHAGAGEK